MPPDAPLPEGGLRGPQPQNIGQLGPTVRGQVWPTYPRQSASPNTWSVIKYYSCGLAAADPDNVLNTEAVRQVRFDLPTTVLGWDAGVQVSDGSGFPVGWSPLDCFKIKFETVGGEKITLDSRLAGSVVGTGQRPGFAWGGGWPFGPGSNLVVTIIPRLPGLAAGVFLIVDLSFPCLQTRIGASMAAEQILKAAPLGSGI